MAVNKLQPLVQMQPCVEILLGRELPDMRGAFKRTKIVVGRVATKAMADEVVGRIPLRDEAEEPNSSWLECRNAVAPVGRKVHTSVDEGVKAVIAKLVGKRAMDDVGDYCGVLVLANDMEGVTE